jgi:hypothetical protein
MKNLYTETKKSFINSVKKLKVPYEFKSEESPYFSPDKSKISTEFLKISNETSKNFLILTTGTVGPDYYLGSQVLNTFLADLSKIPEKTGVIVVHGVNSWGAAWLRPGNINNVNLSHNFCFSENVEELEEDDEKLQEKIENYKKLEDFINASSAPKEISTFFKILWKSWRIGYLPLVEILFCHQRFNHIGLGFAGKCEESEVERTKEIVEELLPNDCEKVVHVDIQTSCFHHGQVFVKVEDESSFGLFKGFSDLDVVIEKNQSSIITGLKDSENWESGALSIFTSGPISRFKAFREENYTHHTNVWVENWSRGEQISWPITSYIESRSKRRLLKNFSISNPLWQKDSVLKSSSFLSSLLNHLSK